MAKGGLANQINASSSLHLITAWKNTVACVARVNVPYLKTGCWQCEHAVCVFVGRGDGGGGEGGVMCVHACICVCVHVCVCSVL